MLQCVWCRGAQVLLWDRGGASCWLEMRSVCRQYALSRVSTLPCPHRCFQGNTGYNLGAPGLVLPVPLLQRLTLSLPVPFGFQTSSSTVQKLGVGLLALSRRTALNFHVLCVAGKPGHLCCVVEKNATFHITPCAHFFKVNVAALWHPSCPDIVLSVQATTCLSISLMLSRPSPSHSTLSKLMVTCVPNFCPLPTLFLLSAALQLSFCARHVRSKQVDLDVDSPFKVFFWHWGWPQF